MATRLELRQSCAETLNSLSKERLLKDFAISRIGYLSGLDVINVPIYTATRVLSRTIAIHAGKNLDRELSRAGAIAEAIEFEVAEHPYGDHVITTGAQLPQEDRLPVEECFPTRSSIVNDFTLLAWEQATNIQNGAEKFVPSDVIWLVSCIENQPLTYFQMTSNGLASGASLEDAILSGLYEIVERDGWTITQYMMDTMGIMPRRVPLVDLPPQLEILVRRFEEHKLRLHLFDCTTYGVPVFNATLLDLSGNCAGTFAGYGCHLDAATAGTRAITEAIQGRACYISGARDDLLRRQFLLMKRLDQVKLDTMFSELECGNTISEYRKIDFPDVKSELRYLLKLLKSKGVSEVFVKELGTHADDALHVVRVFSPQCEPHRYDGWAPSLRCLTYAQRRYDEIKKEGQECNP